MKIDMNAVEEAAKRAIAERGSGVKWPGLIFMFFIIAVICICGFVFLSIYYQFWLFCMSS